MKSRTRLPEGRTAEVDGHTSEARERQPVSARPNSSGYAQELGQLRSGIDPVRIEISTDGPPIEGLNRTIAGMVEDAMLLVLSAFLFALAILAIGTPIALCVRLVLEIARRL